MRNLVRVIAVVLLAAGAASARSADHYDMGPSYQFIPETGGEVNTISFSNGYVIDTRSGEPGLPSELRTADVAGQPLYHIIQFTGPVRQDWLRRLDRLGVKAFGYLPNYAVVAKLGPAQRDKVAALPMVRWLGIFQPAYKIQAGLLETPGTVRLAVLLMPGEPVEAVRRFVLGRGGAVDEAQTSSFGTTVMLTVSGPDIPALAGLQEVAWVQRHSEATVCNNSAQWVTQTGWSATAPADTDMVSRRVWARGVRGQRVVLSTTDTGLNTGHDMFRDPGLSITPPGIWPDHRKVTAYKLYQGASTTESPYHGSHVNGTVAGDDSATSSASYYDGMSIKGRLYFVDVSDASGSFVIGDDLTPLWDTVHLGRGLPDSTRPVKQHSGSWRAYNYSGTYELMDASTDAYCWAHKDFLNIMAAGNEGASAKTIGNPAIAKNVITVGATGNSTTSNTIASFSSRGPTQDNRIKPNVCAPGVGLWSAYYTGNSYQRLSGTSMATPAVNGAAGLIRCYLQEGYYPTGAAVPGNKLSYISSALMRSMVMASADPNIGSYVVPSFDMGWGRIDVDSVLYFTGDSRKLIIRDDTTGVATGEYKQLLFTVNSGIPLRVCAAWTDTAAAPSANPTLVNNLDLELVAPGGGTTYRGNQYSGGQSVANPTVWDTLNVEECARVNSPASGLWTLRVRGRNVRTAARQPFAVTITGDVALAAGSPDVGVLRIVAPAGTIDSGTPANPRAWVKNYGSGSASFPVTFRIGALYSDVQSVTALAAGDSVLINFAAWSSMRRGTWATACTTGLTGDSTPANNGAVGTVTVRVVDAAAFVVNSPVGTYAPGQVVTPSATWKNAGTEPATFWAYEMLRDPSGTWVYRESSLVAGLDPGQSVQVNTFPAITLRDLGGWEARCSTALTGDAVPGNDVIARGFLVATTWVEVASMPRPLSGKDIKDGAWLTYMRADEMVYAAKGNKTFDFYSYSPADGEWTIRPSVPFGTDGKALRKGSCAAADGVRYIYVAKGNSTLGFYRYDIVDTSWVQLPDVPAGRNKVKAGAGMAYAAGYIYLLKGSNCEFDRFNTVTGQWEVGPLAPYGVKPRWDKGSWIVYDGDTTIYAHKATKHELWGFEITTGTWDSLQRAGMPFISQTGRSKKSKDGGAGAWHAGSIFALKGGNTNEFWEYRASTNTWSERDTIPTFGSTNRRKRVNAGGAITCTEGSIYVFKGNKTVEMWRYTVGAAASAPDAPEGVMAGQSAIGDWRLSVGQNPATGGGTVLRYSIGGSSPGRISVADALGRTVLDRTVTARSASLRLDLPAGVYLVRLSGDGYAATQKLVVQR